MKKIILGILLCCSVVIAANNPDNTEIKCYGLFKDTEIHNASIFQLKDVDMNDAKKVIEICNSATLSALHILRHHEASLSKEDIDSLYKEITYLALIFQMMYDEDEAKDEN